MVLSTQTPIQLSLKQKARRQTPKPPAAKLLVAFSTSRNVTIFASTGAQSLCTAPQHWPPPRDSSSSSTAELLLPDPPYKALMKEAAYGAAALALWQILIPAVTECDKKFANDGVGWHEPFLCYWDREVAPLQTDNIVISSICGKSIK